VEGQIAMVKKEVNLFTSLVEMFSFKNRKEILSVLFIVIISAGMIALLSVNRNFFTYGV